MSETTPNEEEEETSVRTRYLVTWYEKGRDKVRRGYSVVDDAEMTRPGDPEQRDQLLRKQLTRNLPYGQMDPENIILRSVDPVCNCGPDPKPENCLYREQKGRRFYLRKSERNPRMEVIVDRHGEKELGTVDHTLSVSFLVMVRDKYGHQ